jgi:hypothetical protein
MKLISFLIWYETWASSLHSLICSLYLHKYFDYWKPAQNLYICVDLRSNWPVNSIKIWLLFAVFFSCWNHDYISGATRKKNLINLKNGDILKMHWHFLTQPFSKTLEKRNAEISQLSKYIFLLKYTLLLIFEL